MNKKAVLLDELRLSGLSVLEISKATGIGARTLRGYILENKPISDDLTNILEEFLAYSKSQIHLNNPIDGFVPKKYVEILDHLNMPGSIPKVSAATGIKADTLYSYRSGRMRPSESDLQALILFLAGRSETKGVRHVAIDLGFTHTFPGCDTAGRMNGNSMAPKIINQALCVGKVVDVAGHIENGEIYGVQINGQWSIKYLSRENGDLKLECENKTAPDMVIKAADVTAIFRVYFIVNPA